MRGTTAFKVPQDLVEPSLCSGCYSQSFWTLNEVEPHVTYPNLNECTSSSPGLSFSFTEGQGKREPGTL